MATPLDRRSLLAMGALAALPWAAARAAETEIRLPEKLRLGLIGPALRSHYSAALDAARDHPEIEITAVGTLSDEQERVVSSVPELKGARLYSGYQELLDSEELDAVCICDENGTRAETTMACLERGIPTVAEKPIAASIEELEKVEQTAARTKTPLSTLLEMRYEAPFVAMKEIVASGVIGEPAQLSGQKSYRIGERPPWMTERSRYGGTISYIGCHVVDLMTFITGKTMTHVAGFHGNLGMPQVGDMENTSAFCARLDNGGTADVRLDYLRPATAPSHGDDRLRIAGTEGIIEYQNERVTLMALDGPPREVAERPETRRLIPDFLDSVFNDGTPMLTSEDVFRVARIVIRARDAADAGVVLAV